jgi:hypothetical protein
MKLTRAQRECLQWLADPPSGEYDDGYLTEEGGQAWYGLNRTNTKLVNWLLRHCLISVREESQGVTHYAINEDGIGALKDPNYVPRIDRPNYGEQ